MTTGLKHMETKPVEMSAWWLPRLLGMGGPSLRLDDSGLTFLGTGSNTKGGFRDDVLVSATAGNGFLWTSVTVGMRPIPTPVRGVAETKRHRFGGFKRADAERFVAEAQRYIALRFLEQRSEEVRQALV